MNAQAWVLQISTTPVASCSVWAGHPTAIVLFFFSSRRRHTRLVSDWSSDVCSSDLFETLKPIGRDVKGGSRRRKIDRRRGGGEQRFEFASPVLERFAAQIAVAHEQQVEEHERRGNLLEIGRASCRERV